MVIVRRYLVALVSTMAAVLLTGRLAPGALVFVRIMAPKGITPAQQSAHDQAVAGVALIRNH
jgi:hypothetical protein